MIERICQAILRQGAQILTNWIKTRIVVLHENPFFLEIFIDFVWIFYCHIDNYHTENVKLPKLNIKYNFLIIFDS